MSDETTGVMTSTGTVYFQKVDYRYQNKSLGHEITNYIEDIYTY